MENIHLTPYLLSSIYIIQFHQLHFTMIQIKRGFVSTLNILKSVK